MSKKRFLISVLSVSFILFMASCLKIKESPERVEGKNEEKSNVQYKLKKRPVRNKVPSTSNAPQKVSYDYATGNMGSRNVVYEKSSSFALEMLQPQINWNTEEYGQFAENTFRSSIHDPLSTFSIDVDTASYSNIRRFIEQGCMPLKDAVRIEEMINYFTYDYPEPSGKDPFSITTEISEAPWNKKHQLVHIGLQGERKKMEELPANNLVFLIDVSGSMRTPNKLPLLKKSFKRLVDQLRENDRVSMVVYAGAAGLVLPPTSGSEKSKILDSLNQLDAGGSTAGGAGIKLAYETAKKNFIKNGNNRVILASDGDFNVGVSNTGNLIELVEKEKNSGIYLTILGFGRGNLKDHRMEQIADKGNGQYHYIDQMLEAKKVFGHELCSSLYTIAKDVKIQVEFNPAYVKAYRLIGYENRRLKKEDFNDDEKDAGDIGAGHSVTALYEIIPAGSDEDIREVDQLKYQNTESSSIANENGELLTVKFRYKRPEEQRSQLITMPLAATEKSLMNASNAFKFSAAVAEFGMLLKDSEFKGDASYDQVLQLANASRGDDSYGYRKQFVNLVKKSKELDKSNLAHIPRCPE